MWREREASEFYKSKGMERIDLLEKETMTKQN